MKKRNKKIETPDSNPATTKGLEKKDPQELNGINTNAWIYQQALELSAEGITQCNEEGLIILWNKKLEEISGFSKDKMLGKSIWDVHFILLDENQKSEAYFEQLKQSLTQALRTGKVPGMGKVQEREITRLSGEKILVEGDLYSIKTTKGYSLVSITREITERKRIEVALKDSEKKYKSLYENAPLSFQSLDDQGIIIDVNPAWLRTLGYQWEDVVGKNFTHFLHPENARIFEEHFPIFKKQGYIKDVHYQIRHYEGHYLDILIEGCTGPLVEEKLRTYCVFQDISERMLAEEAAQRSEQRLRSIFSSAPIGIGVLADRVFMEVNDYVFQLLGYTDDELIGKNSRMIYPTSKEYDTVGEELYQIIHESGLGMIQTKLKHKDGHEVEVILSAAALDKKDLGKGITFTALDITEMEKARAELISAAQKWKTTFNAVDDAICLMDEKMRIVQHNTTMEQMFPDHKGDINGRFCFEIVHGSSKPIDNCPVIRAKKSLTRENLILNINDKYVEITADPLLGNHNQFAGAVHTIRDQTEQIRAKEELEKSNKIITNSPAVAMLWKNEQGWPIEHVTQNVPGLLGYSPQEVLNPKFTYQSIIYPADGERVAREVENAVNDENLSFTHNPYRIITKDQEVKWVRDNTSLRFDPHGNITHFEGIITDITGEMMAMEKLNIRTHQLELILDSNLALNASLDLEIILRVATESAHNLLNIDTTAIYLVKGNDIYLGATVPTLDPQMTESIREAHLADHPHVQRAISGLQPVIIPDALTAELNSAERMIADTRGLRTIVYLPIIVGQQSLGVLILGTTDAPQDFAEDEINIGKTLAAQIAASLQNAILHDQLIQHARDLEGQIRDTEIAEERAKTLARKIIHLQEDERKRISREMHDEMGQLLTAISLDVWNLGQSLDKHDIKQVRQRLGEIRNLVDELDDKVGEITLDLRPPMLDDLGLAPTLRWYVDHFIGRTDIEVGLEIEKSLKEIPPEIATALYRITQEALTNVVKHAQANHVVIDLICTAYAITLRIKDDGHGFKFEGGENLPSTSQGMGLIGIRDRADLLGGTMQVQSQPGQGTMIEVEIPL